VASIVEIVVPLRDSPGTTAIPWAMPTIIADLMPTSFFDGFIKFVRKSKIAVTINENGSILYVNDLSMMSLKIITRPQVISVAMNKHKFVLFHG